MSWKKILNSDPLRVKVTVKLNEFFQFLLFFQTQTLLKQYTFKVFCCKFSLACCLLHVWMMFSYGGNTIVFGQSLYMCVPCAEKVSYRVYGKEYFSFKISEIFINRREKKTCRSEVSNLCDFLMHLSDHYVGQIGNLDISQIVFCELNVEIKWVLR